jgi:hypothetical protein
MDAEPPPTDVDGPSVRDLIGQLLADTKDYARAEMGYLRAELGDRTSHLGPAVGLMVAAGVLVFAVIVAIVVGLMIWIGEVIGLGWSILIVTFGFSILAYGLVRLGLRHLNEVTRPWEKP